MQTINPSFLMQQAFNAPPASNRPSNPEIASQFANSAQQHTSSPSPYRHMRGQGVWMGSVGFTTRFTRNTMGYNRATPEIQSITHEPEPLQPLFGRQMPVSPPPEPARETPQVLPRDRMGGDMAWVLGQQQSSQPQTRTIRHFNLPRINTCTGEQRWANRGVYINTGYRQAGTSR
jgi:hypothetical protein